MNPRHRIASIAIGLLVSTGATALDVNVVGLFPNKAVVQIDGGALQTLSVGQKTRDDIILLSVGRDGAMFDIQGRRVALAIGPARRQTSPAAATQTNLAAATQTSPAAAANYAVIPTNDRGDLVADGEVNGMPVRFAVDTGATFITLPAREASRLGLDYHNGQKLVMETANGNVFAYRLKLDTVRVGGVAVHNVDAVITEGNSLPIALLGMSFLNRTDMKREGSILTLTKRN
ncbi:MAG: retroviral-like aspartic protease family protein [Chloroflexota bacterium]|nr:retroviral-like aspartic protease family protein [Chloroflexota bacterium]